MYEDIRCPRCGKRYFQVKQHNTDFGFDIMPLVLKITPDPIYKDGVLQNPPKPEPVKERFRCLECGCNFRSEIFYNIGDIAVIPNIIDEDLELQNQKEKLDNQKSQPDITDRLTIG